MHSYSRRVLWLEVGTTNNDPSIVAYYFLRYVKRIQGKVTKIVVIMQNLCLIHVVLLFVGTPCILRTDLGTENSTLAFMQPFLRRNHSDRFHGIESFRYGMSTSNQVCAIQLYCLDLNICAHFSELKHGGAYCDGGGQNGGCSFSK